MTYIGHYGCSKADKLVRVQAPGRIKPHHSVFWQAKCPACGEEHRFKPMWRVVQRGELQDVHLKLTQKDQLNEKITKRIE